MKNRNEFKYKNKKKSFK